VAKWIEIILTGKKPKTNVWEVRAIASRLSLGKIKWYGGWKKYAFYPEPGTIYEEDCLNDITAFIVKETKEHKSVR
jgi:hypothetical protein